MVERRVCDKLAGDVGTKMHRSHERSAVLGYSHNIAIEGRFFEFEQSTVQAQAY
jgi:hypothetical protein